MRQMTSTVRSIVEEACKKETNKYGYGIWSHHIVLVVKYGKLLAQKLEADPEIVEIAALLHDYARYQGRISYLRTPSSQCSRGR